jgi:hypothetical protein
MQLAHRYVQDYRSRLYVLRLLLERVPADRLAAMRALVETMAKLAPPPGEDRGGDGENVSSSLDGMVRLVVGGLYTTLHAADP